MLIENGVLYNVHNSDFNADGSFVISDGVTSIGDQAFSGCTGLTSITIPDSVTSIGDLAFDDCTRLTSISIPDSVTSIGYWAFYGCSRLPSITIPNSVTSIRSGVFHNCSGLTSVTIPDSVTSIGEAAFRGCTGLTSITLPNSVVSIGRRAFSGCSSLSSITIPSSFTSIKYSVFNRCYNLTSKPDNYKAFSLTKTGKLRCIDKIYTVGKKSMARGELTLCENGIHYCTNLFDIFNYYCGEYGKDFVIGICEVSDETLDGRDDSKRCARWIKPTKVLTREEVIKIMNGDKNDEN